MTPGVRKLGSQGLQAPEQGLGCMSLTPGGFYVRSEEFTDDTSLAVLKRAFELGVALLDTADFYGETGQNELLIGKAIKGLPREKVVIADKFGPTMKEGKMGYDVSPQACRERCQASLDRLGVDYLDLWILRGHGAGEHVEDAIRGMKAMVDEGKVKYLGVSELSPENIRKAHAVHPISAMEMEWSLFTRDCEEEVVPVCRELGIGFLAYSPMGRGLLTGQLPKPEDLPEGDFRKINPRFAGGAYEKNMALVEKVKALADKKGCTTGQLALAWVQNQGDDVIPIPGTKRVKYLEQNVAALDVKLTKAELRELEDAVPHDQVTGDRYKMGMGLTFKG